MDVFLNKTLLSVTSHVKILSFSHLKSFLMVLWLSFAALGGVANALEANPDQNPAKDVIASIYEKRSQIDPSDTEALAQIDLSLVYAMAESENTGALDDLIDDMMLYISAPIDEDLKSYIFFTVFYHYIENGHFNQAFDVMNQYDLEGPAEATTLRRYTIEQTLGSLYLMLNYHDKAIEVIEALMDNPQYQSLDLYKRDSLANFLTLSGAYSEKHQGDNALLYAQKAKSIFEDNVKSGREMDEYTAEMVRLDIEAYLAEAEVENKNYVKAMDIASQILTSAQSSGLATYVGSANEILGRAHLKLKQLDKAERHFRAITDSPTFEGQGEDDADVYAYLGSISEQRGDYKQAITYFRKVNDIRTKWRAKIDNDRLAFLTAQNENAQQMQQILELRLSNEHNQSAARRNRQFAVLGVLTTALAIFAFVISIRTSQNQRAAKNALALYASKLELSEAKARENEKKAQAANQAKTAFLANMSHEIRTPMNGVLGMAQVLESTDLNERQKEFLKTITTSGDALMTILNDILDISKVEAGKLELEPLQANLRNAIEDVASVLGGHASKKGLEFIIDYQPGIPENVIVDIGRMRQILMNLVGNALKFTETGHVMVKVSAEKAKNAISETSTRLIIQVSDTGIGIKQDNLKTIFEDFNQADNSISRKYGGTGLGLSISQKLITAMGGTLNVQSVVGKGTCFTIAVDFETSPLALEEKCIKFPAKRVLIVDGKEASASVLYRTLETWGLSCDWVNGGAKAYRAAINAAQKGAAYDLIIVDFELPDYSGENTVKAIRRNEQIGNVEIILTSCIHNDEGSLRLKVLDLSGFMPKPIKRHLLQLALEKAFQPKAPLRSATQSHLITPASRAVS